MLTFADITIPTLTARHLAAASDPRTADDDGYAVKSALAEAYGHGNVRPWRLVSRKDGMFRLIGAVRSPETIRNNPVSRKLGIVVEAMPFDFEEGSVVDLRILATPVKRISQSSHSDPENREPRKRTGTMEVDVSVTRFEKDGRHVYIPAKGDELAISYMGWLIESLSSVERGIVPVDLPHIVSTKPAERMRKVHGEARVLWSPCVDAKAKVRIQNVEAFEEFVFSGLKKMKDVGLGSVIPETVFEELAA
jgi:hypothetical protein